MKSNLKFWLINIALGLVLLSPVIGHAALDFGPLDRIDSQITAMQNSNSEKTFSGIVSLIINSILDPVIILLIALALVYFMWGVLLYVNKGSEGGDRTKGIQMMSYGILAIFVMVSVWGLVYILIHTFDLNNAKPPVPKLPS